MPAGAAPRSVRRPRPLDHRPADFDEGRPVDPPEADRARRRPAAPRTIDRARGDGIENRGLSSGKARYILNLAEAVVSGELPLEEFDDTWDDQTITRALTAVKGIGVWTAEMFLIFVMNRPDVFPAGDLGVRVALRDRHGLAELPAPRDCHSLAEPWRPYRTVASWYIWRGIDTPRPASVDKVAESRSVSQRDKRGR